MDTDRMIKLAQDLGLKVTLNSDTAGVFISDKEGNKRKVEFEDFFPELKELDTK